MEMDASYLPQHVFLSYSQTDEPVVSDMRKALEEGFIPLWFDKEKLAPGTPQWEESVRKAISSAYCVVLVCSPHARTSPFVQAEVALAQHHGVPILPVWIAGSSWIDAAPLSLSQTQYLDATQRCDGYSWSALASSILSAMIARTPRHAVIDDCFAGWYDHLLRYHAYGFPNYVSIILDESPSRRTPIEQQRREQMVVIDPRAYTSVAQMLDDLFMAYLSNRVRPITYGKEWIIQGRARPTRGINPDRIVAPWSFLRHRWTRPIAEYDSGWGGTSLQTFDMIAGSVWKIKWAANRDSDESFRVYDEPIGLAVQSDALFEAVMCGEGKQPASLEMAGYLECADFEQVDPCDYRHAIVISNTFGCLKRVFREGPKPFNNDEYQPYGR